MGITLDGTDQGSYSTGSSFQTSGLTCSAGDLVLLWTNQAIMSATPAAPSSTHLAFQQVGSAVVYSDAGFAQVLTCWAAMPSVALAAEKITVNMAAGAGYGSAVVEAWKGAASTIAGAIGNVATAHGSGTTLSASVTTSKANSEVTMGCGSYGGTASPGSGQTLNWEVGNVNVDTGAVYENSTTPSSGTNVTPSITTTASVGWAAITVEVTSGSSTAYSRTASDSLTVSDSAAGARAPLNRTTSDSVGTVGDTATRKVSEPRTGNLQRWFTQYGLLTAQLATLPTEWGVQWAPAPSEVIAVADSARTAGMGPQTRASSDSVTVSDTAARAAVTRARTASDSIAITSSVTAAGARPRTSADSIALSDAAIRAIGHARGSTDTISVSDTAARAALGRTRAGSDTLAVSDTATDAHGGLARTSSDSMTVTDSTGRSAEHLTRGGAEVIAVSDVALRLGRFARTGTDTVAVSSSLASVKGRSRAASDSLAVGDSTQPHVALTQTAGDTISVSELAAATGGAPAFPVASALWVRELPPLRLHCLVTAPNGRVTRWSDDDWSVENRPGQMTFSTVMPGGYEQFSCQLARKVGLPYTDLQELSRIDVEGIGGLKVWQGRLEKQPVQSGDSSNISPQATGYQSALDDDNGVRMIPVDRDMSNWIDPSYGEQVFELEGGFGSIDGPSVTPDTATGLPTLALVINGSWTASPQMAAWYDSHGVPLLMVMVNLMTGPGIDITDPSWDWELALLTQNSWDPSTGMLDYDDQGNLAPYGDGMFAQYASIANRVFAQLSFQYNAAPAGADGVDLGLSASVTAVYGDHGLGMYPYGDGAYGVLASDVCAAAVAQYASELAINIVQPTQFVIPHLVFWDPSKPSDIIKQALQTDLFDWWVDEGTIRLPTFNLAPQGGHGRSWQARSWPAKLEDNGPSIDHIYNGVIVAYTDVTGTSRMVGPPGSIADVEDPSLYDPDPENPCNQGPYPIERYALVQMQTSTWDTAIQVGALFLQEQKELDTSGQAALVGHVQDTSGVLWPAWMVKAGDQISFIDAADSSPRRIVHASWDDATKTNTIQLDQPPDGIAALLERLSLSLIAEGLS